MRLDNNFQDADVVYDTNKPVEETGYIDNFNMAVGQMLDHQSSISELLNSGEYWERNRKLKDLNDSGELNGNEFKSDNDFDWASYAQYAKDNGYEDIKTEREIMQSRRDTIEMRTEVANEVFANQGKAGMAGMVAGYITGGAADPVIAASSIAGPLALTRYLGTTAAGVAATEAISAVVGEAAIQYGSVMDWEESIGVEYDNGDAMLAIASAGVLSGTIAGVATKLGNMVKTRADTKKKVVGEEALIHAMHEAEQLKKIKPRANWVDVNKQLVQVEKELKAPRMTSRQAEEYIVKANSIPAGKPRIRLKVKGKAQPKEGVETKELDEMEAVDAEVESKTIAKEDLKYVKTEDVGRRNDLLKQIALIEAAQKVCKTP